MAKAIFQPLGDRVLVLVDKQDSEKVVGSIIIPNSVREKSSRGTVVAVSDGYWNGQERTKVNLEVGDRVQFAKWAGLLIDLNETDEFVILSERDVLGVFRFTDPTEEPASEADTASEEEVVPV